MQIQPNRRQFLRTAGQGFLAAAAIGNGLCPTWADSKESAGGGLIYHTEVPPNAEPPIEELVKTWITPEKFFYVRSHAASPQIDADQFRLKIEGMVNHPGEISLKELMDKYPSKTVIASMTCAGNRRNEHSAVRAVDGVQWQSQAIGNASWTGIPLSEVLKAVGVQPDAKHVWFEGLDEIKKKGKTIGFGGSIPLSKAMDDTEAMPGALLTHKMNGLPLTPDHGYPLRTVVPGYIGARSVKWLGKIVVSNRTMPNHYVQDAYKLVEENTPTAWAEAGPLYRYPMNCGIARIASRSTDTQELMEVTGYALPPGNGRTLKRVEVSVNGGRSWQVAKFEREPDPYVWSLWKLEIPVRSIRGIVYARAVDSAGEAMPERVDWNMKGYMFNSWYRKAYNLRSL
ncbi:molybdopterin-dependent oxidoreductase [Thalassoroseus pseudoceratinae]|uniref:molybdopterin-dependent oxidoreductase n=1 Tax=Thalassoroseus pseudoceratinae TaxID=2713176 RepID=UPI00141FF695|nr:molybdopterin-dependent oxidoreductase [Thalassoroseus pseudoceratinae]